MFDEENPIEKNWIGFTDAVSFFELTNSIENDYFYDLAHQL